MFLLFSRGMMKSLVLGKFSTFTIIRFSLLPFSPPLALEQSCFDLFYSTLIVSEITVQNFRILLIYQWLISAQVSLSIKAAVAGQYQKLLADFTFSFN